MLHRGVEFTVTMSAPGSWSWRFRIGDTLKSGRTETRLKQLAIRRVKLRIDRELRKAAAGEPGAPNDGDRT
jgi:hypothetical protein